PKLSYKDENLLTEALIGEEDTTCFSVKRYVLSGGSFTLDIPASIWVCTDGEGVLLKDGYEKKVKKGDYFFLPAAASGEIKAETASTLTLVACIGGK
ncbi:MAG: mannose-6-phosphate isomerase, partial [Oscillospiraceae bacterium]|nr:mannose-6-phosphate isomerase [Oscillospiraceae bacterium]